MNEKLNAISGVMTQCRENAKASADYANLADQGSPIDDDTASQHREYAAVWKECADMLQSKISLKG